MRGITEEERDQLKTEVRVEECEVEKGLIRNTDGGGNTAGRGKMGDNRNFEN